MTETLTIAEQNADQLASIIQRYEKAALDLLKPISAQFRDHVTHSLYSIKFSCIEATKYGGLSAQITQVRKYDQYIHYHMGVIQGMVLATSPKNLQETDSDRAALTDYHDAGHAICSAILPTSPTFKSPISSERLTEKLFPTPSKQFMDMLFAP